MPAVSLSLPIPEQIQLKLPSGQTLGQNQAPVRLHLQSWSSLRRLHSAQIGALAEDYVEGRLSLQGNMRDIMTAVVAMLPQGAPPAQAGWVDRCFGRWLSRQAHTRRKDSAQIEFHYDLSDAFYALWLDPRRVYSCAYYRQEEFDLAQAQEAKLDHICRKLMLKPGERFLDVGAGWGALLLWAAEHYGVDATGITLSKNQQAYVQGLIEDSGLQHRVRIELRDYRDLEEAQPYDKIASVGMFEHVGRAHLQEYFAKLSRLLRSGGLLMNHGITAGAPDHHHLGAGLGSFIEKYIFPGGELMHTSIALAGMAHAGLEMVDTENLRPHYARTLWAWSDALESKLDAAEAALIHHKGPKLGPKTLRAYRLYLAGCAMAFEQGWIALHQMLAARPSGQVGGHGLRGAQSDYPFRRDHLYAH